MTTTEMPKWVRHRAAMMAETPDRPWSGADVDTIATYILDVAAVKRETGHDLDAIIHGTWLYGLTHAQMLARAAKVVAAYDAERLAASSPWWQRLEALRAQMPATLSREEYESRMWAIGWAPESDRVLEIDPSGRGEFDATNDPDHRASLYQLLGSRRHLALLPEIIARRERANAARQAIEAARPETGHCWECGRMGTWNDAEGWYACPEHWQG